MHKEWVRQLSTAKVRSKTVNELAILSGCKVPENYIETFIDTELSFYYSIIC